jgi:DNA gyrase subunit B
MTTFSFDTLSNRLREISFLNAGFEITITDERPEGKTVLHRFDGGIREFVETLNKNRTPLHEDVIYFQAEKDGISVEIAMQWSDAYSEADLPVHEQRPEQGRRHAPHGSAHGLTRVINNYGTQEKLSRTSRTRSRAKTCARA